jgi:Domain of unknown function (DUF4149)
VNITRFLLVLALSLWIGGIIFFAATGAPAVLHFVPDRAVVGAIINQLISKLHWMGVGCGIGYLIFSFLVPSSGRREPKSWTAPRILLLLMIALALASQLAVLPAMAALRGATDPALVTRFARLHYWSVGLECSTLVLGLIALYQTVRRLS